MLAQSCLKLLLVKPRQRERGVALVMVLWMVMVMMTLSVSLMYAVKTESRMVSYARDMAQARAFADAATHYAVMQLFLPLDQREIVIGGGATQWVYATHEAEIRIVGENGLIDINRASRDLLRRILALIGVIDQEAEGLLDKIEDFRDPSELRRALGATKADYERAGLAHGPKNAPFERIEELQQVLDMTPEIYRHLSRYLSVHSRGQGVNPMMAPRHVLLLLAEGDSALVDDYIRLRHEAEGAWVQPSFGAPFLDTVQQPYYRLQIKVNAIGSNNSYFEERAIRVMAGRNPPFMTYFRLQKPANVQFE